MEDKTSGGEAEKEDAVEQAPPAQTDWGLIAVLALGALGSNTAMASLLTCQVRVRVSVRANPNQV